VKEAVIVNMKFHHLKVVIGKVRVSLGVLVEFCRRFLTIPVLRSVFNDGTAALV